MVKISIAARDRFKASQVEVEARVETGHILRRVVVEGNQIEEDVLTEVDEDTSEGLIFPLWFFG